MGESPGGPWHGPSAPAQCRPKCSTGGQAEHMVPFLNPMDTILWTPGIDSPCHGELVGGSPKNLGTGKCHAMPGGLQGLAGSQHAGKAGGRRLADGLGGRVNRYEPPLTVFYMSRGTRGPLDGLIRTRDGPCSPCSSPQQPQRPAQGQHGKQQADNNGHNFPTRWNFVANPLMPRLLSTCGTRKSGRDSQTRPAQAAQAARDPAGG